MPMTFPPFLFIEVSDDRLPVAIGWSLPDGQLKHTLIQPLESWEGDPMALGGYELDTLHATGQRPLDILRELEHDHGGETLYINGLNDDEAALEALFDEYGLSPCVTLMNVAALYPTLDDETWRDLRYELLQEQGLTPMQADHELLAMLLIHRQYAAEDEGDTKLDVDSADSFSE